jgi:hypothetical protein
VAQRSQPIELGRTSSPSVRAARYAFALAVGMVFAVGIYLTIEDKSSSFAVKLSALGINLISAAAFSTVFALVDRENRSLMQDQLDERFAAHTSSILEAVSSLGNNYLPSSVYPPTQAYDPAFNRSLMDDLNHSSFYYYRGPSAKYVAARLKALRRRPDLVRIYVPGPDSMASIRFDIANRSRTGSEASADVPALYQRFRDDLFTAVVGLFDCRAYGRIEVFFCDDTIVSRHEITEQHLYVSWYTSFENPSGGKFPETTGFPRSSLHYQAAVIDMERRHTLANRSLHISPALELDDFKAQLQSIFGESYSYDRIPELAREYWDARADFLGFLSRFG